MRVRTLVGVAIAGVAVVCGGGIAYAATADEAEPTVRIVTTESGTESGQAGTDSAQTTGDCPYGEDGTAPAESGL